MAALYSMIERAMDVKRRTSLLVETVAISLTFRIILRELLAFLMTFVRGFQSPAAHLKYTVKKVDYTVKYLASGCQFHLPSFSTCRTYLEMVVLTDSTRKYLERLKGYMTKTIYVLYYRTVPNS